MRTTVSIDDRLLATARQKAAEKNLTLGQFVEEALRRTLTEPARPTSLPALPVFTQGTGTVAGVDTSSNRSLYDALDADGTLR